MLQIRHELDACQGQRLAINVERATDRNDRRHLRCATRHQEESDKSEASSAVLCNVVHRRSPSSQGTEATSPPFRVDRAWYCESWEFAVAVRNRTEPSAR